MTASILLIDENQKSSNDIQAALSREGYKINHALPGGAAIRQALIDEPDLVILGITSQHGGWQFCRRLLTFLDPPLLLLLSSDDRMDGVKGLELGADDCIMRPVLASELVARVRTLLRWEQSQVSRRRQAFFADGDLVVDLIRKQVWLNDEPVWLTHTEFLILSCLVQYAEQVLPHELLLIKVWGPNYRASPVALKQYIYRLRQKLEPDPSRPRRILTRWGEGYQFKRIATVGAGPQPPK